jgi:hypothetical protein
MNWTAIKLSVYAIAWIALITFRQRPIKLPQKPSWNF